MHNRTALAVEGLGWDVFNLLPIVHLVIYFKSSDIILCWQGSSRVRQKLKKNCHHCDVLYFHVFHLMVRRLVLKQSIFETGSVQTKTTGYLDRDQFCCNSGHSIHIICVWFDSARPESLKDLLEIKRWITNWRVVLNTHPPPLSPTFLKLSYISL